MSRPSNREEPVVNIDTEYEQETEPSQPREQCQSLEKCKDEYCKQTNQLVCPDLDRLENDDIVIECSVCLQTSIYPVRLPCRHIFCFLCVKGVANRSKKCALCRQEIPADFFAKPVLVRKEDLEKTIRFDDEYQWYYEGRNGWWKYDDRTSQEIESRHKIGEKVFELLIAGFLYIIDLDNMIQYRRNDRSRKRKMKRDLITIPDVKGVAGLKFSNEISNRPGGDGGEETQSNVPQTITSPDNDELNAPNNTPQTPNTPVDSPPSSVTSSQQDLTERLQQLNLSGSTSL